MKTDWALPPTMRHEAEGNAGGVPVRLVCVIGPEEILAPINHPHIVWATTTTHSDVF